MKPCIKAGDAGVKIGTKWVLQGIFVAIYPGQVWARVGLAGSGKTVLAEVISQRRHDPDCASKHR